jgi:excisionase family DNA binding protein
MRPIDAARYVGVSLSLIRKLDREGRIETARIGTCKLILTRSLDRLLEAGAETPSRRRPLPLDTGAQATEAALADEDGPA